MQTLAKHGFLNLPLAIIAALYTVHFHFAGLAHFCQAVPYAFTESGLAIPPFTLARGSGWLSLAAALLGCFVYVYALLAVLALRPGLLLAGVPLLFMVTGLATYFAGITGVTPRPELIEALLETNTEEARGQMSLQLFVSIGVALGLAALLLRLLWADLAGRRAGTTRPARRWPLALAGVALTAYALNATASEPLAVYPHNLLRAASGYVRQRIDMTRRMAQRRDIAAAGASWNGHDLDDLVVVFVLGESARADHFSLNGYLRLTNPRLATIPNLVSFPNASACDTLTRTAVPCLMTRATRQNRSLSLDETSLLSVFNRAGFTTAWLSLNGVYGRYDDAISLVAKEARFREFRGSIDALGELRLDGDLVPMLDAALEHRARPLLVVLHGMGSHWSYEWRYPPAFRQFTPVCQKAAIQACTHDELINSYDNTILYTDSVLAQVIERLQSRNALLLYVSDHGQLLGENGRYMHGQDAPEVLHVPMIWWASDRFRQHHAERFTRLAQRRDDPVSHDNIFHSLLDCAGVQSSVIDPTLSLCASTTGDSVSAAAPAAVASASRPHSEP